MTPPGSSALAASTPPRLVQLLHLTVFKKKLFEAEVSAEQPRRSGDSFHSHTWSFSFFFHCRDLCDALKGK